MASAASFTIQVDDHVRFRQFGVSFDFFGDVDGDHVRDIVIGSPFDGLHGEGRVYVYSVKTGALLQGWLADQPNDGFGRDVADVGDVDHDGTDDIAIGIPFGSRPTDTGRVEIRSGRSTLPLKSWSGEPGETRFGREIQRVGDVDGDQVDDLLVNCCVGEFENPHGSERFVLLSTATGKRLAVVTGPPGVQSTTDGRSLSALGDVNHDGIPDFAVAFGENVRVCSGKNGKPLFELRASVTGNMNSNFGHGFAFIGDVNGDGCCDIAIGASGTLLTSGRAGFLDVYSGKSGALMHELEGDPETDEICFAVGALGDVNGDGVPEFIATNHGAFAGSVSIYSGKDSSVLRTVKLDGSPDVHLGWRVVGGVDVDGDHVPDFMVAAFRPTSAGVEGQGVYVYSGATGKLLRAFTLRDDGGPPPGVGFPQIKKKR